MSLIEKLFKVKERGSSTKTEFLGAISAYLAVCYLFIVVPGMLADAGMPIGDATVATIWAAILGTLMIAFIATIRWLWRRASEFLRTSHITSAEPWA